MDLREILKNKNEIYMIGIKGTGMCAFAELLHHTGARISGSDTVDVFYTDDILRALKIPYSEGFDAANVPQTAALVIHSAAYSQTNPEIKEALRLGLPVLKYTDALGEYSKLFDSSGIAGVHGKTTTTAMAGVMLKALALPAQVLAGSATASFGDPACEAKSTLCLGNTFFIAETCEYRKHFLAFHPKRIVLTSVESDHEDFFPTYQSILEAFIEYAKKLPDNGALIYCADDKGASEAALALRKEKQGIACIPYGFTAEGDFRIERYKAGSGTSLFSLAGFSGEFSLRVPGRHNVLNAAAAFALVKTIADCAGSDITNEAMHKIHEALCEFKGSKRRAEIVGEASGILFIDDYAHHPTAVKSTLAGLKDFYPERRLVVSFMSHTYTRTAALLDEFSRSFSSADIVILHKIYPSAREVYSGGVDGKTLFNKTKALGGTVYYADDPLDAAPLLTDILRSGDLFVTMGAGDNWKLGRLLFDHFNSEAIV